MMGRPGLTQHRKFRRLSQVLGGDAIARGTLELLWDGCYQSGDEYLGEPLDIAIAACWPGDPCVLVRALADAGGSGCAGFIEPDGDRPGWRIHDLLENAPDYVQKRLEREIARKAKGKTLSDVRREAGRQGREAQIANHLRANGGQLPANNRQLRANVQTPAPAPAPAPNYPLPPQVGGVGFLELVPTSPAKARPAGFDFELAYKAYPRKEGKGKGIATCKREIKTQADFDDLLLAIENYAHKCRVEDLETKYIKHFSSFMSIWRDYAPTDEDREQNKMKHAAAARMAAEAARREEDGTGFDRPLPGGEA